MGWDTALVLQHQDGLYFNPPTPHGVGHSLPFATFCSFPFQSTHPAWGGTLAFPYSATYGFISIHPPRMGWDVRANADSN